MARNRLPFIVFGAFTSQEELEGWKNTLRTVSKGISKEAKTAKSLIAFRWTNLCSRFTVFTLAKTAGKSSASSGQVYDACMSHAWLSLFRVSFWRCPCSHQLSSWFMCRSSTLDVRKRGRSQSPWSLWECLISTPCANFRAKFDVRHCGQKNPHETSLPFISDGASCLELREETSVPQNFVNCSSVPLLYPQCRDIWGVGHKSSLLFFFFCFDGERSLQVNAAVVCDDRLHSSCWCRVDPGPAFLPLEVSTQESAVDSRRTAEGFWTKNKKRRSCPWLSISFGKTILRRVTFWLHAMRGACIRKDKPRPPAWQDILAVQAFCRTTSDRESPPSRLSNSTSSPANTAVTVHVREQLARRRDVDCDRRVLGRI